MISYHYRPSLIEKEVQYDLAGRALACSDGRVVDFADIASVRLYDTRDVGGLMRDSVRRCIIRPFHGRAIVLASATFLGIGRFEDRSAQFEVFVAALIKQVAAANPRTRFITGMPVALWCLWAFALAAAAVTMPLAMGSLLLSLLGDSTILTILVAASVLAVIAVLLLFCLRSLLVDWPRPFDPRIRAATGD